ncbi:MAG: phosphoenolpyruvate carboxylase [Candidatus Bathyarchaeota archaeon]|nr:phosphoenolpyruvate carboxylase [Candidatus Bathyarchaeota archaeon]
MSNFSEERIIPRSMSTQHPDNASAPFWQTEELIEGDSEIQEAYFAYKELGCHEVMWDSEGKDTDIRVVRKLLSFNPDYFKENVLGKNIFLTYRIPNPRVEITERKIVVETLQNIAAGCDVGSAFYKCDVAPIFEVILPMTTDSSELLCLFNYYRKAIVGTQDIPLHDSVTVKDWIGSVRPNSIQIIPLIEDMDSLLKADKIVEPYIDAVKPNYVRVFLARSDPALNYGLVCATVLSKIALSKLKTLENRKGVPLYPIVGVGSLPFRGHLSPDNLDLFLKEYQGVTTATVQSGLKYDFALDDVKRVVSTLNEKLPFGEPVLIDSEVEKILLGVIKKFQSKYQLVVEDLAPLISSVVPFIPKRRARKLHIGLFGYSRNVLEGVALPRAITFAAVFYSLGIPAEFVGLSALTELTEEEQEVLNRTYVNLRSDLNAVAKLLSWQNINMLMGMYKEVAKCAGMEENRLSSGLTRLLFDINVAQDNLGVKFGARTLTQRKYENALNNFLISYLEQQDQQAKYYVNEAAKLRKSLG